MTGISSTEGLELAEIVFYALAVIPAFYCFAAHGKHGVFGWLYVIAMCGLRLVGNGMAYHSLSSTGHPNETAEIITGIGLSPILLAALGILHEANHSVDQFFPSIIQKFGFIVPHVTIIAGIALAAASKGKSSLLEAGMIVLTIGWLTVVAFVAISFRVGLVNRRTEGEEKLIRAIMIATPLIGVRIIYSVIVSFIDGRPEGGSLAIQVIFGTLPEFLVMITYISAGILTRNMARERQDKLGSETAAQKLQVSDETSSESRC